MYHIRYVICDDDLNHRGRHEGHVSQHMLDFHHVNYHQLKTGGFWYQCIRTFPLSLKFAIQIWSYNLSGGVIDSSCR